MNEYQSAPELWEQWESTQPMSIGEFLWEIADLWFNFTNTFRSRFDIFVAYLFWGFVGAGLIFILIYGATKDKKYSQRAVKVVILAFAFFVIRSVMGW